MSEVRSLRQRTADALANSILPLQQHRAFLIAELMRTDRAIDALTAVANAPYRAAPEGSIREDADA